MDKNKFSVGFRKDRKKEKYFGFRKGYDQQYEATISKIILNGEEVTFDRFAKIVQINDYELKHVIADGLWIHNRIHERYVQESLVVDTEKIHLEDVEVWYELHLKGFKAKGKKADVFTFELDTKEKIWIPKPRMWVENLDYFTQPLKHRIVKKDGRIFYVKYFDDKAKNWAWMVQKYGLLGPGNEKLKGKKTIYIDSTTYYSTSSDGDIKGTYSTSWSTARTTGATVYDTATAIVVSTSKSFDKQLLGYAYTIRRGFLYFDTSDIPDGATIDTAALSVYVYSTSNGATLCALKGTQASALSTSDFTAYSGSSYGTIATSTNGYKTIDLDATGKSDVSTTGTTKYCLMEYTYDYADSPPSLTTAYTGYIYSSEYSGTSYDPKLVIDYTEASGEEYEENVGYTAYAAVAVTAAGVTRVATITYTANGAVSCSYGLIYSETIALTGYGSIVIQAIDTDIEIILIAGAGSVSCEEQAGYHFLVELTGAGASTIAASAAYSQAITYQSYATVEVATVTDYICNVNYTSLGAVVSQDKDSDIELITFSGYGSFAVSGISSLALSVTFDGAGTTEALGHRQLVSISNITGTATFEIDAILGKVVEVAFGGAGSVTIQDIDIDLEIISFGAQSETQIAAATNYSSSINYTSIASIVAYDLGTDIELITFPSAGTFGVWDYSGSTAVVEYQSNAAIEITTVTAYIYGINYTSTASIVTSDIDADIELITFIGAGAVEISRVTNYTCSAVLNAASSVELSAIGNYFSNIITTGLSFVTFTGHMDKHDLLEVSSHASIEIITTTDYTYSAVLNAASSVTIQDIDYDIELILFSGHGLIQIQDLELIDYVSKAIIIVYTVWTPLDIIALGAGSLELVSNTDYVISATYAANGSLFLQDIDSGTDLIELTGMGSITAEIKTDFKKTLNIIGIGDLAFNGITAYIISEAIACDSQIGIQVNTSFVGENEAACASSMEVATACVYHSLIEVNSYSCIIIQDVDADIEILTFGSKGAFQFTEVESINYASYGALSIKSETSGATSLFWAIIVGQAGDVEIDLTALNIIEYARFTDEKGKRSDYFEISLYNDDGALSETFEVGNEVFFYVDENDPPVTKIFHGIITSVEFELDEYRSNRIIVSGEDYGSIRAGQTTISGAETYNNKTADEIVADIISRYCPEITTANLETFAEAIPSMTFAWEYVGQAIDKVASLVGADFYIDENDDLNFYDAADLSADHVISSGEITSAKIKRDAMKYFDRVYVVGGKQGFLDFSQTATTTEVSLDDKSYASTFTPSKSNILFLDVYTKKVGNPLDDLIFTIVEDNGGNPTGSIVGFGSIPQEDISTDGGWVKTTLVDCQLDISKTNWIVFNILGTATDTYKVAHNNTTASGHKYKTLAGSWTAATGKLAFKTYYGVQIVKSATTETMMFEYHTDIPIIDLTIQEADTALTLAQQKAIEYALKNASRLIINPPGKRLKAGQVIEFTSLPGMPTLEDQTILSVTYEIKERQISTVTLTCTATDDFYSAFANLFSELRRLKVKNIMESQEQTTDYKELTETPTVTLSENIYETATDYEAEYDDNEARWDVSNWT